MLSTQRDTCKIKLKEKIGEEIMEECEMFIKTRKEARHFNPWTGKRESLNHCARKIVLKRVAAQTARQSGNTVKLVPGRGGPSKQNSNIIADHSDVQCRAGTQGTTNKWVINISDKPLTGAEEKLLAHGPNFVVVPRKPTHHTVCCCCRTGMFKARRGQGRRIQSTSEGDHPKDPKTKTQYHQGRKNSLNKVEERPFQDGIDSR